MTSIVRNVTTVAFPHLTKRAMLRKAVIRRRNLERLNSTEMEVPATQQNRGFAPETGRP